jgi:uncharacterized protein
MTSAFNLTDGEKLILIMLTEIYEHLRINDGIDPQFVQSAISSGNVWGLKWKYPAILGAVDPDPATVSEVVNLLEMWECIESSYDKLSAQEKALVDGASPPISKDPKFSGFDEALYNGTARFLIDDLEQFSSFNGRGLNSPYPAEIHDSMFAVFKSFRSPLTNGRLLGGRLLNAKQLTAIFQAI